MSPQDAVVPRGDTLGAARRVDGAVLVGIDPGTRILGYGAVAGDARRPRLVEAGVVRAKETRPLPERLERIAAALDELFAELRPAIVVVERAFAGRNVQSALRLGECRGIALAAAHRAGAIVVELSPAQAKRAVAGHGAATKTELARTVFARLRIDGSAAPIDASDALALALAWQQGVVTPPRPRRAPFPVTIDGRTVDARTFTGPLRLSRKRTLP